MLSILTSQNLLSLCPTIVVTMYSPPKLADGFFNSYSDLLAWQFLRTKSLFHELTRLDLFIVGLSQLSLACYWFYTRLFLGLF